MRMMVMGGDGRRRVRMRMIVTVSVIVRMRVTVRLPVIVHVSVCLRLPRVGAGLVIVATWMAVLARQGRDG